MPDSTIEDGGDRINGRQAQLDYCFPSGGVLSGFVFSAHWPTAKPVTQWQESGDHMHRMRPPLNVASSLEVDLELEDRD